MQVEDGITRRKFLKNAALAGAASVAPYQLHAAASNRANKLNSGTSGDAANDQVPKRPMGRTGLQVSILGLGGYHLGSTKNQTEANDIVARAIDAGVNFFDNAWEYHDGLSEERLGAALQGKRDQVILMTKVCTHGRKKDVAMQMLEESLRRLKTDHIDVWQIHEVIYENDPDLIFAPRGAAEALAEAKQQGKVRFIGFTGHKDPSIHLKMLSHDFPFDTVQMPLNCFDASFRSFETHVLPVANRRGMAVFGMKSLGGSGEMVRKGGVTPRDGLSYAMSLPVSTTISGIESPEVLEQNLEIARGFKPLAESAMKMLRERSQRLAADGRLELFKTTKKYDGAVGRQQHHYPTTDELPA
jgi:aryl-alcohol dehydrogenase-like predicted oxidoreductase